MNFDGRIFGNALHLPIADNSIQMVMTSPPYFGLRDYGIAPTEWGGDPDCEHEFTMKPVSSEIGRGNWAQGTNGRGEVQMPNKTARKAIASEVSTGFCIHCECWKGTFGLEPTPDLYIQHTVDIFREVRRVLKPNGTLWLNLGDSYAGSWGSQGRQGHGEMTSRSIVWARQIAHAVRKESCTGSVRNLGGLKPKDMLGIPWRVAFALQADGWYLRMDIIWSKNNPMPESVFDRPTKSHEYIFLLSKSKKYFYDRDGGSEPVTGGAHSRGKGVNPKSTKVPSGWMSGDGSHRSLFGRHRPRSKQNESFSRGISKEKKPRTRRNLRSVWKIPTQSYPDAHYATFPPKLVEPCVRAGSRVGDFVLDPFAGSGTVAMVSEQLGRRWVAVDLGYQELQGKRLEKLQKVLT